MHRRSLELPCREAAQFNNVLQSIAYQAAANPGNDTKTHAPAQVWEISETALWQGTNVDLQVKAQFEDNPDLTFSKPTGTDNDALLLLAAIDGDKEKAASLLAGKANVNARGRAGWTPLMAAAVKGHKEVAELLLANKADVNAKANSGATAWKRRMIMPCPQRGASFSVPIPNTLHSWLGTEAVWRSL